MADIEKVIKGLDCCLGCNDCDIERNEDCPYKDLPICASFLRSDVIELLKEQEAKTVELIQKMDRSNKWGADLIGYCPSCKRPLKLRFNK